MLPDVPTSIVVEGVPTELVGTGYIPTRLVGTAYNRKSCVQAGEEFDETTPDGRETKAVVTFDSGKIVTVQTAKKAGQKSTRVRTSFS